MNEIGKTSGTGPADATLPPPIQPKPEVPSDSPPETTAARTLKEIRSVDEASSTFKATYIHRKEVQPEQFEPIQKIKATVARDEELLKKYGEKHANLVRTRRLALGLQLEGIEVPEPNGLNDDDVGKFFELHGLSIVAERAALHELYDKHDKDKPGFLERDDVKTLLEGIRQKIDAAFAIAAENNTNFRELVPQSFIESLENAKGHYLMVRSTGSEDTDQIVNAGGNISCAYVDPTPEAFCKAAAEILCSYYENASLENQISANPSVNPFTGPPRLAVTSQKLIGEKPIADPSEARERKADEIPVSLVLFTNEPLYVGSEKFRVMRISASYGHGEGVVGGVGVGTDTVLLLVSNSHPNKLYVLYDNADKPQRMAPVMTGKGVELQLVENNDALRCRPVLSSEQLSRLYTWGVIGEKFFEDNATDMELVIKGDTIYPVQARPVVRKPLVPTYLDVQKIKKNVNSKELPGNPVSKSMRSEIVVSGTSSVVTVSNPEEVCYAPTLAQAEKLYRTGNYKAVIVTYPEPANSHPVANFSNWGVPCLYVKDQKSIEELLKSTNAGCPLVLCMQEGTINLWDSSKGDVDTYTTQGYTAHPAQVAISLPVSIAQCTHGKPGEIPEDVHELLIQVRSAETTEVALDALRILQEHSFVRSLEEERASLAQVMKKHKFVPRRIHETHDVLDHLINRVTEAFTETQAALANAAPEDRLHPLMQVKVLQTLLTGGPSQSRGVSQYSRVSVDPFVADARELVAYQAMFDHPVHFADIYLAGDTSFDPASKRAWRAFLEDLENSVESQNVTPDEVERLHIMIHTLDSAGMLGTWFAFFCNLQDPVSAEADIAEREPNAMTNWIYSFLGNPTTQVDSATALKGILETFPSTDDSKINKAGELAASVKELMDNVPVFAKPEGLKNAQKKLRALVEKLTDPAGPYSLSVLMEGASPVTRLVILNTLQEVVDLYDTALKKVKASQDWTQQQKAEIFIEMLTPFYHLLRSSIDQLKPNIPMNPANPLPEYLNIMDRYFDSLRKLVANASLPGAWPVSSLLAPSQRFNVAAATMGSMASFERTPPESLEDFFTLTHQNCEFLVAHCKNEILTANMIKDSALPPVLKEALEVVETKKMANKITKSAIEINDTEIKIKYNIPLRNHSARLVVRYNKTTGETTLIGSLLSEARERWPDMASYIRFLDENGNFPLHSPIVLNGSEATFDWIVKPPQRRHLNSLLEEFDRFCTISLTSTTSTFFDRLINPHRVDPERIFNVAINYLKFKSWLYAYNPGQKLMDMIVRLSPEIVENGVDPLLEKILNDSDSESLELLINICKSWSQSMLNISMGDAFRKVLLGNNRMEMKLEHALVAIGNKSLKDDDVALCLRVVNEVKRLIGMSAIKRPSKELQELAIAIGNFAVDDRFETDGYGEVKMLYSALLRTEKCPLTPQLEEGIIFFVENTFKQNKERRFSSTLSLLIDVAITQRQLSPKMAQTMASCLEYGLNQTGWPQERAERMKYFKLKECRELIKALVEKKHSLTPELQRLRKIIEDEWTRIPPI